MTVSTARDDRHQIYGALRRLLFLVPPERSHELVFAALRGLTTTAPVRRRVHIDDGTRRPVAGGLGQ